ncbi:hypothetical protein XENOCAPTIV_012174 [Xenoophorus captivus]|uniref:Uncharacterized protein n=1 Tax=Xenoophorus captivus TaxID=1517983 RepID=A0ABV0QHW3_9TELE
MRQTWPCTLLCQAGPREGSGKERQGGRGQKLQGWCPGTEAVRWGSIDQQERSSDQLMETTGGSEPCTDLKTLCEDCVTPDGHMRLCASLNKTVLVKFPSLVN